MISLYLNSRSFRFIECISVLFIVLSCKGQSSELHVLSSKKQVDSVLNSIILDEHYIEKGEELKVVFSFKVDSLGEIHSAHIRWSVNLVNDSHYSICRTIENTVNAKFMYAECRDVEVVQKYAVCNYPYYPDKE